MLTTRSILQRWFAHTANLDLKWLFYSSRGGATMPKFFITTLLLSLFSFSLQAELKGIRSDYKPGEIKALCAKYIKTAKAGFDQVAKVPKDKRTFTNTTLALESVSAEFEDATSPILFMQSVLPDKKLRDESNACENTISDFLVEVFTRRDLYDAIKDQEGKTADEKRLQFRTKEGFEQNGLKLPDAKLKEVKKLKKAMAKIQTEFGKNLTDDKSQLLLSDEELKGLRPELVSSLKKNAKGLKILPVNESTYLDVMNSADDEITRMKMLSAWMNRQAKVNTILFQKVIAARQDLAKVLGYKNWFDYRTESRMAKSSDNVRKFLTELKEKLAKANKQDMEQLLAYKKKLDPKATKLNQWDLMYLEFQMKKNNFKVDGNVVREYFPADVVTKGMFEVYSQILGVKYVEVPDAPVWAEGVKLYEVRDKKADKLIGYFYADFFTREGKYNHAAAFPLIKGRLKDGEYTYPITAVVSNFSAPTKDKPSLLPHREVETMFHEFGHVMHGVLTKAPYGSLSGTSTTRDFVEAPSQMLENWVWEPTILEKISGHYADHSKKLPKELLKKMIEARDFQQGRFYTRQLSFGLFDLAIHTESGKIDVTKTYDDIFRALFEIDQVKDSHFPATFGHMMGGYDGGYYGYLWSKVFAQDMFTVFQKEGVLSPKAGARYRENILAPGDMEDANELLKKFLGREPNNKAFFKQLHI